MDIPNQDKDIYNIVEKKNVDNTVVENLLPTPETPKLPDIVPEVSDLDENAKNLDEIVDEVAEVEDKAEKTIEKTEQKAESIQQKAQDIVKTEEKTAPKVEPKVEAKAEVKAEAPKVQPNGKWQIQLVASKNKASVEKTWNDLSSRYSMLKSYPREIQAADLGAQGTFYRLRAGSFADKDAATAACAALKKQGLTDCIAKER